MIETQSARQVLNQMMVGGWICQAIYVAAELGIADLLAEAPQTAEQLAKRSNAHPGALYRLLRALAGIGIFAEDQQGQFTLTPLAERLRTDTPASQRALATMMGAEFYQTWGNLLHSVRTGEEGFNKHYHMPFFEYMTRHTERHRLYDEAMMGIHSLETEPMLDAYDFSQFRTVADIGGGNGLTIAAVLNRHPHIQGILFDLPAVVDGARPVISAHNLSDRCRMVGGDFFTAVPDNVDAYVLRHIIHDWQDDDAIKILRNCRNAMNPKGRILVVESVIPPGNEPSFGKLLDLMMLLVGGRERTQDDFSRLFSQAGLRLNRVVPTAHEVSVIEGVRQP